MFPMTSVRLLAMLLGVSSACAPPACDRVDEGSCVNACCKLSWTLVDTAQDALEFCTNVSHMLETGGPDGRFALWWTTPMCQANRGTYVVHGNHTTANGTYVDLVQIAAQKRAGGGLSVYAFSHSLIPGEFASSDFGQQYKNLVLLIKQLGLTYDEQTLWGCPSSPPPASESVSAVAVSLPSPLAPSVPMVPAVLPEWAIGSWSRDFEQRGSSQSTSMSVVYVQGPFLFSDCRVPKDRPLRLWNATSLDDYDEADLALLAQAHGFAGGTVFEPKPATAAAAPPSGIDAWMGNLTWHHTLTDYQNVCVDPAVAWPQWLNGTHQSTDVGAIELLDAAADARMMHEHAYPIDTPVVQYEQWHALTSERAPTVAITWPLATGIPSAMLVLVGAHFAYARDRPVHVVAPEPAGVAPTPEERMPSSPLAADATSSAKRCSLQSVLARADLSLEEKRRFFDAELSFGNVTTAAAGHVSEMLIVQSTLPFREGHRLGANELCRPGAQVHIAAPFRKNEHHHAKQHEDMATQLLRSVCGV